MKQPHTLILGGARSGKSRFAEQLASNSGKSIIYLATANAGDNEMAERIARHQLERDGRWQVIEEPLQLAKVLKEHGKADRCILVDCLTLWLSNCLCQHGEAYWLEQKAALLDVLKEFPCEVIFVSNEVGHGIVPLGELSRQFVDHSGWLHQSLAKQVARVEFIIAGLAQTLKREQ
ncbi:adenosylcobinamide kinase [Pseudoalteromonas lipolytica SCSIO 04301]|uniref:bifunctional adenosylcobinamide kinase/adenosylcobinamide-phosphate guanylyltransferase n=1 Tax=Pseudoalteromonas lipolytica TaxID=570156 RepID=UPI00044717FF|nr:bifunctional adenosylcobinamide kinase/adenosylcobinamide-phosphate guanylyltransferase [Pseudoalteromonas lipolytica]EWH07534.1 adenosylcobinamide kinase [Pseudoalteromonas lipolytica SCSIO 04301]